MKWIGNIYILFSSLNSPFSTLARKCSPLRVFVSPLSDIRQNLNRVFFKNMARTKVFHASLFIRCSFRCSWSIFWFFLPQGICFPHLSGNFLIKWGFLEISLYCTYPFFSHPLTIFNSSWFLSLAYANLKVYNSWSRRIWMLSWPLSWSDWHFNIHGTRMGSHLLLEIWLKMSFPYWH